MRKDSLYFLSVIVSPVAGIISTVLAMRFVEPSDFGYFQLAQLVFLYLAGLHLGLYSGFARQYSILRLIGQDVAENLVTKVGFFSHLIGAFSSIILLGMYIVERYGENNLNYCLALLISAPTAYFVSRATYYDIVFRVRQDFNVFGKLLIIQNAFLIVSVVFPAFIGYFGLLIRMFVVAIVNYFIRWNVYKIKSDNRMDFNVGLSLVKIGFPILLGSYFFQILFSFDRIIISYSLDTAALGLYAISSQISAVYLAVVAAISSYFLPKAISGAGNSIGNVFLYMRKSIIYSVLMLLPMSLCAYFMIGPFISYFLPTYSNAISSAEIVALSGVLFAPIVVSFVFVVLNRAYLYIVIVGLSLFIFFLSARVIPYFFDDITIELIAWMKLVFTACFSCLLFIIAYFMVWRGKSENVC